MKELEEQVVKAFRTMVESGQLEKSIQEKVARTVNEVLDESLKSWSPFGKALKEHVATQLNVDFRALGLGGYNDLVLSVIRSKLDSLIDATWKADLEKGMEDLLRGGPSEIKLSELMAELKETYSYDASQKGWEHATCIVESKEGISSLRWVHFDPEPQTQTYRCRFRMLVHADGTSPSVSVEGKEIQSDLLDRCHGFTRTLFQLRTAKTKIIFDLHDGVNESYYEHGCSCD